MGGTGLGTSEVFSAEVSAGHRTSALRLYAFVVIVTSILVAYLGTFVESQWTDDDIFYRCSRLIDGDSVSQSGEIEMLLFPPRVQCHFAQIARADSSGGMMPELTTNETARAGIFIVGIALSFPSAVLLGIAFLRDLVRRRRGHTKSAGEERIALLLAATAVGSGGMASLALFGVMT